MPTDTDIDRHVSGIPTGDAVGANRQRFDSSMHSKRGSHSIGAISADGPLTFVEPETVMDVHATQEPQR